MSSQTNMESVFDALFHGKWFRWALIAPMVLGGVGAIFSAIQSTYESEASRVRAAAVMELENEIKGINAQMDELRPLLSVNWQQLFQTQATLERFANLPPDVAPAVVSRLDRVEQNVQKLDGAFSEFRKALNPTDPTKVLTVARLGDKFDAIQEKQTQVETALVQFKGDTTREIEHNYDRMDAQVDRITGMFQWLWFILIPVGLNTFRDVFWGRPHPAAGSRSSQTTEQSSERG